MHTNFDIFLGMQVETDTNWSAAAPIQLRLLQTMGASNKIWETDSSLSESIAETKTSRTLMDSATPKLTDGIGFNETVTAARGQLRFAP